MTMASGSNTNNTSAFIIHHAPTVLKNSANVTKQGVLLKATPMTNITQLQKQPGMNRQKTYFLNKGSISTLSNNISGNNNNIISTTPAFKAVPGPGGQTVYKPNFTSIRSDPTTITAATGPTKTLAITTMVKKNSATVFIPMNSSSSGSISINDRKIITTKALKPPRQLPPPTNYKLEPNDSSASINGEDAEVANINKDVANIRKMKRKSQSPPLQLFCDERLDRRSPELWPENGKVLRKTKHFNYHNLI